VLWLQVWCCTLSFDGQLVLSASRNRTFSLCPVGDGTQAAAIDPDINVLRFLLNNDGCTVVALVPTSRRQGGHTTGGPRRGAEVECGRQSHHVTTVAFHVVTKDVRVPLGVVEVFTSYSYDSTAFPSRYAHSTNYVTTADRRRSYCRLMHWDLNMVTNYYRSMSLQV